MTQPAAATTARDGSRVYWVPKPDGDVAELVSNSTAGKVLAQPAIVTWMNKMVAKEVASDPDLAATARIDPYAAVKAALDRNRNAAQFGDDVHAACEQVDLGEATPDQIPMSVRGHVLNWERCKQAFSIEVVAVERTVFNHAVGSAGTLDRIIRFNTPEPLKIGFPSGRTVELTGSFIADIKTGAIYPEHALQTSAYANAEAFYDSETNVIEPLPDDLRTDVGFAIHLEPDNYELIPLDYTEAWPAFIAVVQAWQWKNRHEQLAIGRPMKPPAGASIYRDAIDTTARETTPPPSAAPSPQAVLLERIMQLGTPEKTALKDAWPAGCPSLKTDTHTPEQLAALETLIAGFEPVGPAEDPPDEPQEQAVEGTVETVEPETQTPSTVPVSTEARRLAPPLPTEGPQGDLVAKLKALPVDLQERVNKARKAQDLPSIAKPCTDRQLAKYAELAAPVLDEHLVRQRRVVTSCIEAGLEDDDQRHDLIRFVTGGEASSSKELTDVQARNVVDAAAAVDLGLLTPTLTGDGWRFEATDGEPTDWKQVATDHGTSQAELLRRARRIADEIDARTPSALKTAPPSVTQRLLAELRGA